MENPAEWVEDESWNYIVVCDTIKLLPCNPLNSSGSKCEVCGGTGYGLTFPLITSATGAKKRVIEWNSDVELIVSHIPIAENNKTSGARYRTALS